MAEIPIRQLAKIIAGAIVTVLIFFIVGLSSQPIVDMILDSRTIGSMLSFVNVPKQAIDRGRANTYYLSLEGPKHNIVVGTICSSEEYQNYIDTWKEDSKMSVPQYERASGLCKQGYCFCILKISPTNGIDWHDVRPFIIGDDYDRGLLDEIDAVKSRVNWIKVLTCTEWPVNESGDPYKIYVGVPSQCKQNVATNWLVCFVSLAGCLFSTEVTVDCSDVETANIPVVGIVPYTVKWSTLGRTYPVPVEFQDISAELAKNIVYVDTVPTYEAMEENDLTGMIR